MFPLQENASKPEGLPPSQGGKYVGFGSGGSAPPPRRANGSLDDVSLVLSKGFSQLTTAAGMPEPGISNAHLEKWRRTFIGLYKHFLGEALQQSAGQSASSRPHSRKCRTFVF